MCTTPKTERTICAKDQVLRQHERELKTEVNRLDKRKWKERNENQYRISIISSLLQAAKPKYHHRIQPPAYQ